MIFCHISDTHLGYNAYRKIDKISGLNLREADSNNAFKKAIDRIIEIGPDFVLHTGDLFDSFRPYNRTVSFAVKELLRLSEITKVVIISGNHSTPRSVSYGSVFEVLELFPEIKSVYRGDYENIQINDVLIHAVPQSLDDSYFHKELAKIELDKSSYNILAVHCGIQGQSNYSMNDFSELLLPQKYLKMGFDYVALGHFHKMAKVSQNAYYCGSTERFSLNEADEEKGFLVVDTDTAEVNFEKLPSRKMINVSIDLLNLDSKQLDKKITETINKIEIEESIVKIKFNNVDKTAYRQFDDEKIKTLTQKAAQFSVEINLSDEQESTNISREIGNIEQEFVNFVKAKKMDNLADIGIEYLKKAKENETG